MAAACRQWLDQEAMWRTTHARVLLSQFSLDQPPALPSRYPAGLTLSHSGVSTSNPRGDMLLLGPADKPRRKQTAAQTLLPSTEVLQKVPNWLGVEGGAGSYTADSGRGAGRASGPGASHRPVSAPSHWGPRALHSHLVPSPSHVTSNPQCLLILNQDPAQYPQWPPASSSLLHLPST